MTKTSLEASASIADDVQRLLAIIKDQADQVMAAERQRAEAVDALLAKENDLKNCRAERDVMKGHLEVARRDLAAEQARRADECAQKDALRIADAQAAQARYDALRAELAAEKERGAAASAEVRLKAVESALAKAGFKI